MGRIAWFIFVRLCGSIVSTTLLLANVVVVVVVFVIVVVSIMAVVVLRAYEGFVCTRNIVF